MAEPCLSSLTEEDDHDEDFIASALSGAGEGDSDTGSSDSGEEEAEEEEEEEKSELTGGDAVYVPTAAALFALEAESSDQQVLDQADQELYEDESEDALEDSDQSQDSDDGESTDGDDASDPSPVDSPADTPLQPSQHQQQVQQHQAQALGLPDLPQLDTRVIRAELRQPTASDIGELPAVGDSALTKSLQQAAQPIQPLSEQPALVMSSMQHAGQLPLQQPTPPQQLANGQEWPFNEPMFASTDVDVIARRTRANYSLNAISLDELEGMLQLPEEPELPVEDDEEYQRFLRAVRGEEPDIPDEEDDDVDFVVDWDDLLGGDQPLDGEPLPGPTTRQRRKRYTYVPKGQRANFAERPLESTKLLQARRLKPLLPAAPPAGAVLRPGQPTLPAVLQPQHLASQPQLGRPPLGPAAPAAPPCFAPCQLAQLYRQMNAHAQLLVQTYAQTARVPGGVAAASQAHAMLYALQAFRQRQLSICESQQLPAYLPATLGLPEADAQTEQQPADMLPDAPGAWRPAADFEVRTIADVAPLRLLPDFFQDMSQIALPAAAQAGGTSGSQQQQPPGTSTAAAGPSSSGQEPPHGPGTSAAGQVRSADSDGDGAAANSKAREAQAAGIPQEVQDALARFHRVFDPGLVVQPAPPLASPGQAHGGWLAGEDELLARGIRRFGTDAKKIQQFFLPAKTEQDIKQRERNRSTARVPHNPVKEAKAFVSGPLNAAEVQAIEHALHYYGAMPRKWELIAQQYMPHRPPVLLPKLFNAARGSKAPVAASSRGQLGLPTGVIRSTFLTQPDVPAAPAQQPAGPARALVLQPSNLQSLPPPVSRPTARKARAAKDPSTAPRKRARASKAQAAGAAQAAHPQQPPHTHQQPQQRSYEALPGGGALLRPTPSTYHTQPLLQPRQPLQPPTQHDLLPQHGGFVPQYPGHMAAGQPGSDPGGNPAHTAGADADYYDNDRWDDHGDSGYDAEHAPSGDQHQLPASTTAFVASPQPGSRPQAPATAAGAVAPAAQHPVQATQPSGSGMLQLLMSESSPPGAQHTQHVQRTQHAHTAVVPDQVPQGQGPGGATVPGGACLLEVSTASPSGAQRPFAGVGSGSALPQAHGAPVTQPKPVSASSSAYGQFGGHQPWQPPGRVVTAALVAPAAARLQATCQQATPCRQDGGAAGKMLPIQQAASAPSSLPAHFPSPASAFKPYPKRLRSARQRPQQPPHGPPPPLQQAEPHAHLLQHQRPEGGSHWHHQQLARAAVVPSPLQQHPNDGHLQQQQPQQLVSAHPSPLQQPSQSDAYRPSPEEHSMPPKRDRQQAEPARPHGPNGPVPRALALADIPHAPPANPAQPLQQPSRPATRAAIQSVARPMQQQIEHSSTAPAEPGHPPSAAAPAAGQAGVVDRHRLQGSLGANNAANHEPHRSAGPAASASAAAQTSRGMAQAAVAQRGTTAGAGRAAADGPPSAGTAAATGPGAQPRSPQPGRFDRDDLPESDMETEDNEAQAAPDAAGAVPRAVVQVQQALLQQPPASEVERLLTSAAIQPQHPQALADTRLYLPADTVGSDPQLRRAVEASRQGGGPAAAARVGHAVAATRLRGSPSYRHGQAGPNKHQLPGSQTDTGPGALGVHRSVRVAAEQRADAHHPGPQTAQFDRDELPDSESDAEDGVVPPASAAETWPRSSQQQPHFDRGDVPDSDAEPDMNMETDLQPSSSAGSDAHLNPTSLPGRLPSSMAGGRAAGRSAAARPTGRQATGKRKAVPAGAPAGAPAGRGTGQARQAGRKRKAGQAAPVKGQGSPAFDQDELPDSSDDEAAHAGQPHPSPTGPSRSQLRPLPEPAQPAAAAVPPEPARRRSLRLSGGLKDLKLARASAAGSVADPGQEPGQTGAAGQGPPGDGRPARRPRGAPKPAKRTTLWANGGPIPAIASSGRATAAAAAAAAAEPTSNADADMQPLNVMMPPKKRKAARQGRGTSPPAAGAGHAASAAAQKQPQLVFDKGDVPDLSDESDAGPDPKASHAALRDAKAASPAQLSQGGAADAGFDHAEMPDSSDSEMETALRKTTKRRSAEAASPVVDEPATNQAEHSPMHRPDDAEGAARSSTERHPASASEEIKGTATAQPIDRLQATAAQVDGPHEATPPAVHAEHRQQAGPNQPGLTAPTAPDVMPDSLPGLQPAPAHTLPVTALGPEAAQKPHACKNQHVSTASTAPDLLPDAAPVRASGAEAARQDATLAANLCNGGEADAPQVLNGCKGRPIAGSSQHVGAEVRLTCKSADKDALPPLPMPPPAQHAGQAGPATTGAQHALGCTAGAAGAPQPSSECTIAAASQPADHVAPATSAAASQQPDQGTSTAAAQHTAAMLPPASAAASQPADPSMPVPSAAASQRHAQHGAPAASAAASHHADPVPTPTSELATQQPGHTPSTAAAQQADPVVAGQPQAPGPSGPAAQQAGRAAAAHQEAPSISAALKWGPAEDKAILKACIVEAQGRPDAAVFGRLQAALGQGRSVNLLQERFAFLADRFAKHQQARGRQRAEA